MDDSDTECLRVEVRTQIGVIEYIYAIGYQVTKDGMNASADFLGSFLYGWCISGTRLTLRCHRFDELVSSAPSEP